MDEELKNWIDGSNYFQLLERWRNAPVGDPIFVGEIGKYYGEVMKQKRIASGHDAAVNASKQIGWGGR